MRRVAAIVAAALCWPLLQAGAGAAEPGPCEAAAAVAERQAGLPAGLLVAIGHVESGRRVGPGAVQSWPWAINAAGTALFADSAAHAAEMVRSLQEQGVRSIDTGCFQVNMQAHPNAFASLDDAFDPASNARYAARFLLALQSAYGSWEEAVARYHSANIERGGPYRERVLRIWTGTADVGFAGSLPLEAHASALLPIDAAMVRAASPRELAAHGLVASPSALSVHVWAPSGSAAPSVMAIAAKGTRLPVVQTPDALLKY